MNFPPMDFSEGSQTSLVFQPQKSNILYEKEVWVRTQRSDREDVCENLTLRISLDPPKGATQMTSKVLKLQLTSEQDPFFLHSLEVSEEDFQLLKAEQEILVDFSQFPSEVMKLVDECIKAREDSERNTANSDGVAYPEQFRAILRLQAGMSCLSVLEVNKFKHLTHIALNFRPGNDSAIKQYLATRLREVKGDRSELTSRLERTEGELTRVSSSLEAQTAELADLKQTNERVVLDMQTKQEQIMNEAERAALRRLEETKSSLEDCKAKAEHTLREELHQREKRNRELESQLAEVTSQKTELDKAVSDRSSRLGAATGELAAAREDLSKLREENRALDAGAHEKDKTINQNLIQLASLTRQVEDKEELVASLRSRVEEAQGRVRDLERSLEDTRESLGAAEERFAAASQEVLKGNKIIAKHEADLRSAKSKAKMKAAVITQQERLVQEGVKARDKLAGEVQNSQQECDNLKAQVETLKSQVEAQRAQIAESLKVQRDNEQTIQWMSKQMTHEQLGGGPGALTSKYTFRPSSLSLTAAPATGAVSGGAPAGLTGGGPGGSAARPVLATTTNTTGYVPESGGSYKPSTFISSSSRDSTRRPPEDLASKTSLTSVGLDSYGPVTYKPRSTPL